MRPDARVERAATDEIEIDRRAPRAVVAVVAIGAFVTLLLAFPRVWDGRQR